MKKIIAIIALSCVFTNYEVDASEKVHKQKIEMKCHVDLYGGGDSIYYQLISENKSINLSTALVNRSIYVPTSKRKKKVYKVNECVAKKDKFSSQAAIDKENRTAR